MTDERGRPLTYWGGKPNEPHAGTVSLPWEKRVIESGTLVPNEPSTEQVPSGLTEGEHLSPQPVPTAGSTAWSEPKQASPNGPLYRTGTSTGIEGPTPRTDAEEYDPFPSEKDPDGRVVPSEFARKLESEIDRLHAALAAERQLRKTTIDRNVAAHAETAAAERQLADLRDRIISITESVQIPAPPGSASMMYKNDYFAGATAYRHALREAIFAALRGGEAK